MSQLPCLYVAVTFPIGFEGPNTTLLHQMSDMVAESLAGALLLSPNTYSVSSMRANTPEALAVIISAHFEGDLDLRELELRISALGDELRPAICGEDERSQGRPIRLTLRANNLSVQLFTL